MDKMNYEGMDLKRTGMYHFGKERPITVQLSVYRSFQKSHGIRIKELGLLRSDWLLADQTLLQKKTYSHSPKTITMRITTIIALVIATTWFTINAAPDKRGLTYRIPLT